MTNYKHIAIILLFHFVNPGLFSQDMFVKGLILSEDSTPVQYATIYDGSLKSGTFSDSLGRYSISIPSNINQLHISAIGYKNTTITVDQNDNLSDFNILLLNDTFIIKEVLISSKIFNPKQIELGPRKKIKGHAGIASVFFNHEIGLYIPNYEQIHGEIKSVELYLKKESGEAKHLIRFRIYSVDEELYPSKDLLFDNILLEVKKSKRDQLIKIDLEKYNIPIPLNGIVVGLESVQSSQDPYRYNLNAQNTVDSKRSTFITVLVDDNTNRFARWDRTEKDKWYSLDFTGPAKQHGLKVTNLVPYFKVTINEYADRK